MYLDGRKMNLKSAARDTEEVHEMVTREDGSIAPVDNAPRLHWRPEKESPVALYDALLRFAKPHFAFTIKATKLMPGQVVFATSKALKFSEAKRVHCVGE